MAKRKSPTKDVIAVWAAVWILAVWGIVMFWAAYTENATVALAAGPMGIAAGGFLFGFRISGGGE